MSATQVHPLVRQASASSKRASYLQRAFSQLDHKWSDIQVGRQGKYSIERLESLQLYSQTTSKIRVFLVCFLTPAPALLVSVLLECLPLRPPSDGWRANWVLWVRLSTMAFILNISATSMLNQIVPALLLTTKKIVLIAVGTTAGFTGFFIALASTIGFPVPFMFQLGFFPSMIFMAVMLALVLGKEPFTRRSPCRQRLSIFHDCLAANGLVIAMFPILKVLYDHVPARYQAPATLLLVMWKFAAKTFMVRSTRQLEDYMPQMVAFVVDFFSSLFVSVCMYSSSSLSVSALVIAVDVLQSGLEFREVRMNAKSLYALVQNSRHHGVNDEVDKQADQMVLLDFLLAITRNPKAYTAGDLAGIRLWACLPHHLPQERLEALKSVEKLNLQHHAPLITDCPPEQKRLPQRVDVRPLGDPMRPNRNNASNSSTQSIRGADNLVTQGLQTLFHCEYLGLVEYVECAIPLMYVVYKSVLHVLPNAVYYPGGAGSWNIVAVGNILLYSLLEVGTFVAFNKLLQRKFAFSPLYQVAFVLENQFVFVQAALCFTCFCLLSYELEHFGADFTLRFQWLHHNS